ncbi:MAG TPA: glycosyltransferase [Gemmatimonadales bacterium]|jgi:cellulose synthase/poly-beta-1,6-N-acetylglucosamine synthase-like glycosyltransferase|nr:glycosyltransferase [Gemmatimonadales bacterium]
MDWEPAVRWYTIFMLLFFFAINSYYLILTITGFWRTIRDVLEIQWTDRRRLLRSPFTPPISVLAPAYNEQANIVENVRSLLMLDYPLFEVIVINDGSSDNTLEAIIEEFELRPTARSFEYAVPCKAIRCVYESATYSNLILVDKDNGGKADALNAGLNLSLYPLFCAIDADSILESDALLRLVRPFIDAPGVTIAAGGVVRVANGCEISGGRVRQVRLVRRALPLIQIVEYLRAFLFGRMGWSGGNSLLVISGAFGLFEKRTAVLAGGYAADTVGEDMELVVRMHRVVHERKQPYRIGFVPDPICWTEVPETLKVLRRQRTRWQRGLIDTIVRHGAMIGRPRYGTVGLVSLPAFALFEMMSPLIELSGYLLLPVLWWYGLLTPSYAGTVLVLSLVYAILVSVLAVLLEDLAFRRYPRLRDLGVLIGGAVLENLGYRQLTVWWRVRAFWEYLRGDLSWGAMERRGMTAT